MSEWETWVDKQPEKHWAKYDLSAVKLGWDAGIEMVQVKLEEIVALNEQGLHATARKRLRELMEEME